MTDVPTLTIAITPAEHRALTAAVDRWPSSESAPDGFFELQSRLSEAVKNNPAFEQALKALQP